MNIDQLADFFKPWMSSSTWHTLNSSDAKLFNQGLSAAVSQMGYGNTADHFKVAFHHLAEDVLSQDFEAELLENLIDGYAADAALIVQYLSDTEVLAEAS